MLKGIVIVILAAVVITCSLYVCTKETPRKTEISSNKVTSDVAANRSEMLQSGAVLFKQFCFNCHPDGGNVSDPDKTLHGSTLRKNHIDAPEDIVKIMRKPISRMIQFDEKAVSNKDARSIAEYVLDAFK
jgi:cytochrome c6